MKNLKSIAFIIMILSASVSSMGQPRQVSLEDYKASMDGWLVDLQEAYKLSHQTKKPILANFTGTDWCGWCIRLKIEVFTKPEFISWAKENVILVELDFPRRFRLPTEIAQQNAAMQRNFGVRGYPTLWAFDLKPDMAKKQYVINPLAQIGYVSGGPTAFISKLEALIAQGKAKQKLVPTQPAAPKKATPAN